MRRRTWIAIVVVAALSASAVAVAGREDAPPRIDAVIATLDAQRTRTLAEAFCPGPNGFYREANDEYRGTISSPDPRLNGNIRITGPQLLNLATGFGANRAIVEVFDSTTGKRTARLNLIAVFGPTRGTGNGIVEGDIRAAGGLPRARLTANYTGQLDFDSGHLVAEFGSGNSGASLGQNTAVLESGGCGLEENDDD